MIIHGSLKGTPECHGLSWLIMAYHPVKLALNSRRGLATISGAGFSTTHTTAF